MLVDHYNYNNKGLKDLLLRYCVSEVKKMKSKY